MPFAKLKYLLIFNYFFIFLIQSYNFYLKVTILKYIKSKYLSIILLLGVSCIMIWIFGCPIKNFTGLSCAGCGMTRAWLSLLRLNFSQAYYFHPLFWSVPIMLFLIVFNGKLSNKKKYLFWGCIISLFLIVYFIRLFGESSIVTFNFKESIIYKILFNRRS